MCWCCKLVVLPWFGAARRLLVVGIGIGKIRQRRRLLQMRKVWLGSL